MYDEAIDRTRLEQRQFSSWKRDELREDSGHLSTSGLNCKEEEINGKKLMHEVVCAYIVLPPYKRKREKKPTHSFIPLFGLILKQFRVYEDFQCI